MSIITAISADMRDEYSEVKEKLEPSLRIWYKPALNTFTCVIDGRPNDGKLYCLNEEDIESDAARDVLIMINPDISTSIHKLQKALVEAKSLVQTNGLGYPDYRGKTCFNLDKSGVKLYILTNPLR